MDICIFKRSSFVRYFITALLLSFSGSPLVPNARAGTEMAGARVLVVYRSNGIDADINGVVDSEQLARYYAAKRTVPPSNLLPVNISVIYNYYYTGEYSKFYNDLVAPVKARLATLGPRNIDTILLAGDIPTVLYDGTGRGMSIDSALMGINLLSATTSAIESGQNPYFEPSPSFGGDKGHFDHSLYKYRSGEMYLVARLGSDSSLRGINQVDQSLYAERYLSSSAGYYSGNAYLDSQWGIPYPQPNYGQSYTDSYLSAQPSVQSGSYSTSQDADMNIAYAEHFIAEAGFPLKWENTTATLRIGETGARFSDGTNALAAPRALFYGGWYNFLNYNDVFEWLPGSVACDVNSSPKFGTQALKNGASAAAYVVGEPYLSGHQRPHILLYYILKGYNFAEASALSTPLIGWMNTNEGDPLYAPLALNKSVIRDTQAPLLSSGYPKLVIDRKSGNPILYISVDDSAGPEVVTARVQYGITTNYDGTANSTGGFSRTPTVVLPWAPSQSYHYRVILTDPSGNVTTTQDYQYTPEQSVIIVNPALASPSPVSGTSTTLSVLASIGAGDNGVTYTWSATGPAPVSFTSNGTNSSKQTTASFSAGGAYIIQAVAKSSTGVSAASSVNLQVNRTVTQLRISPSNAVVSINGSQQFTPALLDQFGLSMAPASAAWTVSGGGAISSTGLFSAGQSAGGPFTVTATSGAAMANSTVSITESGTPAVPANAAFHLKGEPAEITAASNGAVVTPAVGPTGTLIVKQAGSVKFAPAVDENGVYFLNCCTNANNAYYRFAGSVLGSIFNPAAGQITFNLISRQSWAQRLAGGSYRVVFDVQPVSSQQLFSFVVIPTAGRLAFAYRLGSTPADYYYIPAGKEDQTFGAGVTAKIKLVWDGTRRYLYVNDVLVNTTLYTRTQPAWSSTSVFTIGAQEYAIYGGYNASDDILDEFIVMGL